MSTSSGHININNTFSISKVFAMALNSLPATQHHLYTPGGQGSQTTEQDENSGMGGAGIARNNGLCGGLGGFGLTASNAYNQQVAMDTDVQGHKSGYVTGPGASPAPELGPVPRTPKQVCAFYSYAYAKHAAAKDAQCAARLADTNRVIYRPRDRNGRTRKINLKPYLKQVLRWKNKTVNNLTVSLS